MYPAIQSYCNALILDFDTLSSERKKVLIKISDYIQDQVHKGTSINLNYICTHNSRRSHFGQLWAAVAANYYTVKNVYTFSGGTEATAFNPNAIAALERTGFNIQKSGVEKNPIYNVYFSDEDFVTCFSKVYSDLTNPSSGFAAIITCTEADEKCPIVTGATLKISTPYDDPKAFDGTALQDTKYDERCRQIALECLFVFSQIK